MPKYDLTHTIGKQLTPNQIRGQIRKYITENVNMSQTQFISFIGVTDFSFNHFMDAKNFREEWKATENPTYWNAANFLATQKIQHKIAAIKDKAVEKSLLGKRTSSEVEAIAALVDLSMPHLLLPVPSKKQQKADMNAMLQAIISVDVAEDTPIYADCDEVRRTLTKFFNTSGITEGAWLRVVQCQSKSLNSFRGFRGPSAGAANNIYSKSWRFFEQKRILEGRGKSEQRLEAERRLGSAGYSRKHVDPKKRGGWLFVPHAQGGEGREGGINDPDLRQYHSYNDSLSESSSSPSPSPSLSSSSSSSTYSSTFSSTFSNICGSDDGDGDEDDEQR